jgi:hypothetical protein
MFRIYQQPMTGVKNIEKAVRDNRSREKSLTEGHKTINIPSKRWIYVSLTRGLPKRYVSLEIIFCRDTF